MARGATLVTATGGVGPVWRVHRSAMRRAVESILLLKFLRVRGLSGLPPLCEMPVLLVTLAWTSTWQYRGCELTPACD